METGTAEDGDERMKANNKLRSQNQSDTSNTMDSFQDGGQHNANSESTDYSMQMGSSHMNSDMNNFPPNSTDQTMNSDNFHRMNDSMHLNPMQNYNSFSRSGFNNMNTSDHHGHGVLNTGADFNNQSSQFPYSQGGIRPGYPTMGKPGMSPPRPGMVPPGMNMMSPPGYNHPPQRMMSGQSVSQQTGPTPTLNQLLQTSNTNPRFPNNYDYPPGSKPGSEMGGGPGNMPYNMQQGWNPSQGRGMPSFPPGHMSGNSPYRNQNEMHESRRPPSMSGGGSNYVNQAGVPFPNPQQYSPSSRYMAGQPRLSNPSYPQQVHPQYNQSGNQPMGGGYSPSGPPGPPSSERTPNPMYLSPQHSRSANQSPNSHPSSQPGTPQSAVHSSQASPGPTPNSENSRPNSKVPNEDSVINESASMETSNPDEGDSQQDSVSSTGAHPSSALRRVPSPAGSTGSRSNTPASLPGNHPGSPMPPRPPSGQIDGQGRLSQSPMATQGFNQQIMPPPIGPNQGGGYPTAPGNNKMAGGGQMPGHYPQYNSQYPPGNQGNFGRNPNMPGLQNTSGGGMPNYPQNIYNGPNHMGGAAGGNPMYNNMPRPAMPNANYNNVYGQGNMGMGMPNQYGVYNNMGPNGPGPGPIRPAAMNNMPITDSSASSKSANAAAVAAQQAMIAAANSAGNLRPGLNQSRMYNSPTMNNSGPIGQLNHMTVGLGAPPMNNVPNNMNQQPNNSSIVSNSASQNSATNASSTSTPKDSQAKLNTQPVISASTTSPGGANSSNSQDSTSNQNSSDNSGTTNCVNQWESSSEPSKKNSSINSDSDKNIKPVPSSDIAGQDAPPAKTPVPIETSQTMPPSGDTDQMSNSSDSMPANPNSTAVTQSITAPIVTQGMNNQSNISQNPQEHPPNMPGMNCVPVPTFPDEPPEKKKKECGYSSPAGSMAHSPGSVSIASYDDYDVSSPGVSGAAKSGTIDLSKLYEMGPEPDRKLMIDKLLMFNEDKGTPITSMPAISKQPLDLYRLYHCVKERGGMTEVNKTKKWKEICTIVNIGSSASAAFTLKKNYIKYLFAFECHFDRGGMDPQPILAQMEAALAQKREQKNKRAPSPAGSQGSSQDAFRPSSTPNSQGLDPFSPGPGGMPGHYMQNDGGMNPMGGMPHGGMMNPMNPHMMPPGHMGGMPHHGMMSGSNMMGGMGPNSMMGHGGNMPPNSMMGPGNMMRSNNMMSGNMGPGNMPNSMGPGNMPNSMGPGGMPNSIGPGNMPNSMSGHSTMSGNMPNAMGGPNSMGPGNMQNSMGGNMPNSMGGSMPNSMGHGNMPNSMAPGNMPNSMGGNMPNSMGPGNIPNSMSGPNPMMGNMPNSMGPGNMPNSIGGNNMPFGGQGPNSGHMGPMMGGNLPHSMGGNMPNTSMAGNMSNSSMPGNHPNSSMSGNHPNSSMPGNHPNSSMPGNHPNSSMPGNHPNSSMPGNHPNSSMPGNHPNSSMPGNHPNSSMPGNHPNSSMPGNHPNSSMPGNHPNSSMPGNHPNSSMPGNHPNSSMPGNHPNSQMPGNHPNSSMPGNHPNSSMPGNHPSSQMPGNHPNSQMPGNHPNSSMPGNMPNSSMPGGMPNSLMPGNHPSSSMSGNMPNSSIPGHMSSSSIPGNMPNSSMPGSMPSSMAGNMPNTSMSGNMPTSGMSGNMPSSGMPGNMPSSGMPGNPPNSAMTSNMPNSSMGGNASPTGVMSNMNAATTMTTSMPNAMPGNIPNALMGTGMPFQMGSHGPVNSMSGNLPNSMTAQSGDAMTTTATSTPMTGNTSGTMTGSMPHTSMPNSNMLPGNAPTSAMAGNRHNIPMNETSNSSSSNDAARQASPMRNSATPNSEATNTTTPAAPTPSVSSAPTIANSESVSVQDPFADDMSSSRSNVVPFPKMPPQGNAFIPRGGPGGPNMPPFSSTNEGMPRPPNQPDVNDPYGRPGVNIEGFPPNRAGEFNAPNQYPGRTANQFPFGQQFDRPERFSEPSAPNTPNQPMRPTGPMPPTPQNPSYGGRYGSQPMPIRPPGPQDQYGSTPGYHGNNYGPRPMGNQEQYGNFQGSYPNPRPPMYGTPNKRYPDMSGPQREGSQWSPMRYQQHGGSNYMGNMPPGAPGTPPMGPYGQPMMSRQGHPRMKGLKQKASFQPCVTNQSKKEIPFPPDTIEGVQPPLIKRRRLTSKDLGPIEAWRLMMALKSGLLTESTWALDTLNILLFDDSTVSYFNLSHLPGLLDVLLEHFRKCILEVFAELKDNDGVDDEVGDCEMSPEQSEKKLDCENYTLITRDGKTVHIEEESKDAWTVRPKTWDKDNQEFLPTDHFAYGAGNLSHIITKMESEKTNSLLSKLFSKHLGTHKDKRKVFTKDIAVCEDENIVGDHEEKMDTSEISMDTTLSPVKQEESPTVRNNFIKIEKQECEMEHSDLKDHEERKTEVEEQSLKKQELDEDIKSENKMEAEDSESKDSEAKDSEVKNSEAKDSDVKDTEAKASEEKGSEVKENKENESEAKDTDVKDTEQKVIDAEDSKATDSEPKLGDSPDDESEINKAKVIESKDSAAEENKNKDGTSDGDKSDNSTLPFVELVTYPKTEIETMGALAMMNRPQAVSDLEEESYEHDTPPLYNVVNAHEELARRCICISNIFRSLSCIPGNGLELSRHSGLMSTLGKLLLLHHKHLPRSKNHRFGDEWESDDAEESVKEGEWWWSCLDALRENTLVIFANICGKLKLSDFPEHICFPILDGLLHWVVCSSSCARDPMPNMPPNSVLSPQRLVLEALCKLCIHDANVDLLLATPPFERMVDLFETLVKLLANRKEQVTQEFAIVLLSELVTGDSSISRAIALQHQCISLLVDFLETAEQNAHQVAKSQGIIVLQNNPESMGTSLDMLRRAATILVQLARVEENRTLFVHQQSRLLALVMSQILDQTVAKILSDVLYECSQLS